MHAHLEVGIDHVGIEASEQLRERAGSEPAQDVHLREAVVRHDVALRERRILHGVRIDVGDAERVACDVDGSVGLDVEVGVLGEPGERAVLVGAAAPGDRDRDGKGDRKSVV